MPFITRVIIHDTIHSFARNIGGGGGGHGGICGHDSERRLSNFHSESEPAALYMYIQAVTHRHPIHGFCAMARHLSSFISPFKTIALVVENLHLK